MSMVINLFREPIDYAKRNPVSLGCASSSAGSFIAQAVIEAVGIDLLPAPTRKDNVAMNGADGTAWDEVLVSESRPPLWTF